MEQTILDQLNKEKENAQNQRAAYIKQKLIFVTSLFGIGSIQIGEIYLYEVLFVVPLIASGYDLYILTEDFKIKRIGTFLKKNNGPMKEWEKWVHDNPNKYAPFAAPVFTFLTLVGSCLIIAKYSFQNCMQSALFVAWGLFNIGLLCFLFSLSRNTRSRFFKERNKT